MTTAEEILLTAGDRAELDNYFNMVIKLTHKSFKHPGCDYSSLEHFVKSHGRRFHRRLNSPFKQNSRCFQNATWMSLENADLTYCEGFALSLIPVLHAWCVDSTGAVIDPTWKTGRAYFGVPFKRSFIQRQMQERKVYGLLDWPGMTYILKAKQSDWKATL